MKLMARRNKEQRRESEINAPDSLSDPQKRGPFYALSFRNYRLFFYGQSISVAGTWMQTVAQQWLVWELTHSPYWLGLVNSANALPFLRRWVLFGCAPHAVVDDRIPAETGRVQNLQVCQSQNSFARELAAVHFRHNHVGEQQSDFRMGIDNPNAALGPAACSTV